VAKPDKQMPPKVDKDSSPSTNKQRYDSSVYWRAFAPKLHFFNCLGWIKNPPPRKPGFFVLFTKDKRIYNLSVLVQGKAATLACLTAVRDSFPADSAVGPNRPRTGFSGNPIALAFGIPPRS
jgi:hypothetical protein